MVLALRVHVTGAAWTWALPMSIILYRTPEGSRKAGAVHKTPPDLMREHLGLETTRGRCRNTVLRVEPCLFCLCSRIIYWFDHLPRRSRETIHINWAGKSITSSDTLTQMSRATAGGLDCRQLSGKRTTQGATTFRHVAQRRVTAMPTSAYTLSLRPRFNSLRNSRVSIRISSPSGDVLSSDWRQFLYDR